MSSISYGFCAVAFLVLGTWLLVSWRGRFIGAVLVAAVLLTAAWAALIAYESPRSGAFFALEALEILRSSAWLLLIGVLLYPLSRSSYWLRALLTVSAVCAALAVVTVVGVRAFADQLAAPHHGGLHIAFVVASIGLSVLGLILLEQLYRNLPQERRWALKFLCLGLATIFIFDLYLYSHTVLLQGVGTAAWEARGLVNALAAPLLLISARRNRDWSLSVYVSRQAAFHTAVMVAVGGYLLVVAIGGYYVRDFGGTWGGFAQAVIFVLALIVLGAVMTSEVLRRRLNVFLNKHFFSRKYDYRAEWLRLTRRLATTADGLSPYARATGALAEVVDSRGGAIWRRGEDGFELAGCWKLEIPKGRSIPEDAAMMAFLQDTGWIIDLDEYHRSPEVYKHVSLPSAVHEISSGWAILPLFREQLLSGIILLTKPKPATAITWEDRDVLNTIALQVESYLSQHEDAQALSQARQFEAFNQLTAFLMHDLKNLIAQQSLIVKNAAKYKHNPEFVDDAFETIGSSVTRMERLLEHLRRREQSGIIERVDIHQPLRDAVSRCGDRKPSPRLEPAEGELVLETERETITMILVHVIRNAQDATAQDGQVTVSVVADDGNAVIDVVDTGSGMSPEFIRDQLFKPFTTTKRTKGMGIGAHQVREFVRQAGGSVQVFSVPGEGTRFRITLPTAAQAER